MVLMKDSLWGIVSGTEEMPVEDNAEARRKYLTTREQVVAIVLLAVIPLLLYLLVSRSSLHAFSEPTSGFIVAEIVTWDHLLLAALVS